MTQSHSISDETGGLARAPKGSIISEGMPEVPKSPLGSLIVTGAARGIGAAVARLGGTRGYAVVVNYLNHGDAAARVVDHIERAGFKAIAIRGDVANERDVVGIFDAAESTFGRITALVNNAGITGGFSRLENLELPVLERVLAVNVTGTMLCAREAVRRMSTRRGGNGGAIVNLSSMAARLGGSNEWIHYAAGKG